MNTNFNAAAATVLPLSTFGKSLATSQLATTTCPSLQRVFENFYPEGFEADAEAVRLGNLNPWKMTSPFDS
jgi:hypothetical protein